MTDPVRPLSLTRSVRAVATLATGYLRPRPVDQRFLRGLTDAGLPTARVAVTVTALRQNPRPVPAAMIVEGHRGRGRVGIALTSFLVHHPEATFIVDPSVCLDVHRRAVNQLPGFLRLASRPPADTVATITALHQQPAPEFALPTHAHWDHVCGLLDLPELPVHLHRREHDWVMTGPIAPVGGVRDSLRDRPLVHYDLDGPPVLTFAGSHDLFGDGAVTLVDLAGHTPGSVGVLLHTSTGWVLLAGDAAWHHDQVVHLRQKSGYPGQLNDNDIDEAFLALHRLHACDDRVRIIPSHDHEATRPLRC